MGIFGTVSERVQRAYPHIDSFQVPNLQPGHLETHFRHLWDALAILLFDARLSTDL